MEALSEIMQPSSAASSALKSITEVVATEKKLLFEVFSSGLKQREWGGGKKLVFPLGDKSSGICMW